ncbi:putative lipid scramblase CLPTM1 [Pyxicephalus adspersus]|uniref:putative lipid scramblase CLPTM1 n=1 Tax=Pyxicephalus adspersus TaxID=30357 RepID=UPI003B5B4EE2
MASPGGETQASINGSVGTEAAVAPDQQNPNQQQQQQQPPPPNAWQVIKGVLFRIFIIWAISSWFRRGSTPQDQVTTPGAPRPPSRNLFPRDTLMDLHVFLSEKEHFTEFNSTAALFWEQKDLVYGDWSSGENGDGCYEQYSEINVPEDFYHMGHQQLVSQRLNTPGPSHNPRGSSTSKPQSFS